MARRVNTRFVMLLGSGLLLAVVVVGSYGVWRYLRNRDPVHLAKLAADAELRAEQYKPGDQDKLRALAQAADYYNLAAIASSKKHREGTEQLYMKVAELEMNLSALVKPSAVAENATEAQGYYQAALSAWARALTENPRFVPAREKYIEELYKNINGSIQRWSTLEDQAKQAIIYDPNYGHAYTYLASARLAMLVATPSATLDLKRVKALDADIKQAMAKDPDSAIPVGLQADLLNLQAQRLPDPMILLGDLTSGSNMVTNLSDTSQLTEGTRVSGAGIAPGTTIVSIVSPTSIRLSANAGATKPQVPLTMAERENLLASAIGVVQAFLAKHPNDPTATIEIASLLRAEIAQDIAHAYQMKHPQAQVNTVRAIAAGLVGADKRMEAPDGPIDRLVKALKVDPRQVRLASALADFNAKSGSLEKGEAVLKALVAAAADDPDAHLALAHYYQDEGKPQEAITEYSEVLQHLVPGGAIAVTQNIGRVIDSRLGIAWCNMDVAQQAGLATDAGKKALANAADATGKLRSSVYTPRDLQDLVDGRLLLLNGNTPEALIDLRRADISISKGSPASPQWLRVKRLLSAAYAGLGQWGNALNYLDQLDAQYPQSAELRLAKADVYLRSARWNDALQLVGSLANAGPEDNVPAGVQTTARTIEAEAYRGLGKTKEYEELLKGMGDPVSRTNLAWERLAQGDKEGAAQEIKDALEKWPDDEKTAVNAVRIDMAADRKEDAKALVEKAIAKFPKNTLLPRLKALLYAPEGDPLTTQLAAADTITDPVVRHANRAQLYAMWRKPDEQFAELDAALQACDPAEARPAFSQFNEQVFELSLALADHARDLAGAAQARADAAKDPATKDKALSEKREQDKRYAKYWSQAELYVQKAERLDLDGVQGKLYRGRFEFAKGGDSRKQGLQILEQAAAARPDDPMTHTFLGETYYMMDGGQIGRNSDKALDEFRQAIREKPDNAAALRLLIDLLIQKGDTRSITEAQTDLNQAQAFWPHDPLLRNYADLLEDPATGIQEREEIAKKSPEDSNNLQRLAALYVKQKGLHEKAGKVDDARVDMQKAIKIMRGLCDKFPDNFVLADRLAHLYRDANQKDDALKMYDHFIASDDPETSYWAKLSFGDMYKSFGEVNAAATTYESAMSNEPDGADIAERKLADLLFDLHQMKQAETLYRQIYAKKKDLPVLRRLVESLVQQSKFTEAESQINTLLAEKPDDPDGWILRGMALLRQDKRTEAMACFNRVLTAHPDNADALCNRAFIQFTVNGDLDQAIGDLSRVRDRDPNNLNARLLLARVYAAARHFGEACGEYEEVIKRAPDSLENRIAYGKMLLSLGKVFQRLSPDNTDDFAVNLRTVKPLERLQALLNESSQSFPDEPEWLVLNGDLQMLLGYPRQAQQLYGDAYRKSNDDQRPKVAGHYLTSLLQTQNYEEVIKAATELLNVEAANHQPKDSEFLADRMLAYAATNKVPEALADFDQALGLLGPDVPKMVELLNQVEGAIKSDALLDNVRQRAQQQPKDPISLIALGHVMLVHNDLSGELKVLEPLSAEPKGEYRSLALRLTASARYQSKDFPGALKDYEALLTIIPNDLETLNNLAYLLAEDMKKPKDALPFAQKAVDLMRAGKVDLSFSNNGSLYDTLGWVKYLGGNINGAITELKTSLNVEPSVITCFHLAKALQKSGDISGARQAVAAGIRLAKARNDPMLSQLEALSKELGDK